MGTEIKDMTHWRERFRQQRLSNVHYWLKEIEQAADPTRVIAANYDNLLRAIEMTLEYEDSFDIGYDLVQGVHLIAFELADWDRWLIYLQGALEMSRKLGKKVNQAYLHEWIADLLLVLTRQDEAEIQFRQALRLYLDAGAMNRYGRILPKLSRIHAVRGEFDQSISLCQEALRLGESHNDKRVIADAYFGLADLYFRSREWDQSLSYAQTAVGFYEDLGDQNRVNRVWYLIIACKTYLGLLQEAEKEARELLDILTDPENAYDNVFNVVQLRTMIGTIAFKQEDYPAAEKHWQEAFQLNTLIGSQEGSLPLRNNLGKAYTQMGEWEEAELIFLEALPFYKQFGNAYGWGNCMDNLADLYEAQKDYAACRATLQEALAYLEPFADQPHIQKLCQMMRERLEKLTA